MMIRQRKIVQYLDTRSQKALKQASSPVFGHTFLDLPKPARYLIYSYLGVVKTCRIDLNFKRPSEEDEEDEEDHGHESSTNIRCNDCRDWDGHCQESFPTQLFYLSRTISDEVCHILYSQNHFIVTHRATKGFTPLRNLRPKSLFSLTSLTIQLNVWYSRHLNDGSENNRYRCDCYDEGYQFMGRRTQCGKTLGTKSREDKYSISEWKNLAKFLGSHINPDILHITFICDTDSFEAASEVVSSFNYLKRLRGCSIRLASYPSLKLKPLAKATVRDITGRSNILNLARFSTLPEELQIQILENTSLVAPYDLRWTPISGFDCVKPDSPTNLCNTCMDVLQPCRHQDSPISAAAECDCWRYPTALFSVSRKFREEALRIFYSRNHFVVTTEEDRSQRGLVGKTALQFAESVPASARKHLRSIQFLFGGGPPVLSSPLWSPVWLRNLDILSTSARVADLVLTLDFSIEHWRRHEEDVTWSDMRNYVENDVNTLAVFKGQLKGFNVYIYKPPHLYRYDGSFMQKELRELETRFERMIMGDGYQRPEGGDYGMPKRYIHGTETLRLHPW